MIYIHNATLFTPKKKIDQGALVVSGETIAAFGRQDELPCPTGAESINAEGLSLVPGFIDLQINGAFGMDFTTDPETIWHVGERLVNFGVTSFLPTIVSSPSETIRYAQAVLQMGPPVGYQGTHVLGLHLEGPYLNPEKHGAHNPAYLSLPDAGVYKEWSPARRVNLVTLAPELVGSLKAIRVLVQNGVVVGAGHSQADLSQAQAGFEAGICYGTHLFNAMPPLDHRKPGLVGALLEHPRAIAGIILDGIHVSPTIIELAWKILGPQRTNLVTDAMAALGMPAGEYQLGSHTVFVDGISARLEDGRLSGSLLSLDQALRNLMAYTGCSLSDALATITQVPARLLHLETILGSLVRGSRADLVLLTPDAHVAGVWINGHQISLPLRKT
jgi:N-acetylglucosamine-6-phosphate deacetylase